MGDYILMEYVYTTHVLCSVSLHMIDYDADMELYVNVWRLMEVSNFSIDG